MSRVSIATNRSVMRATRSASDDLVWYPPVLAEYMRELVPYSGVLAEGCRYPCNGSTGPVRRMCLRGTLPPIERTSAWGAEQAARFVPRSRTDDARSRAFVRLPQDRDARSRALVGHARGRE